MKKIILFCIPFAGGSASSYLVWKKHLEDVIELQPVQLACRGERFCDKPYESFMQMAEDCYNQIMTKMEENPECEYAVFGHSMGSWLTYEVLRMVYKNGRKKPIHVIFSANRAPYNGEEEEQLHELPDQEFIDAILAIGGGQREILEDPRYGKTFVNILRMDYTLLELYECKENDLHLDCNISVFTGIQDVLVSTKNLAWASCTSKNCNMFEFKGGHFFIMDDCKGVTEVINKILLNEIDNK